MSRTGRYKIFPVVGTLVMAVGLYLLSRLDAHTSGLAMSAYMLVLGAGIGLCMQVLTIIVQNTADFRDLGVATSGVTFFRTLGSSFGAAIFGTIYANAIATRLPEALAQATGIRPAAVASPKLLHSHPDQQIAPIETMHRWLAAELADWGAADDDKLRTALHALAERLVDDDPQLPPLPAEPAQPSGRSSA